jgi:hypothetical protein
MKEGRMIVGEREGEDKVTLQVTLVNRTDFVQFW